MQDHAWNYIWGSFGMAHLWTIKVDQNSECLSAYDFILHVSRLVGKDSHGFSCDVKRFVGRLVDLANFGSSQLACPYCLFDIPPSFPWSPLRGDGRGGFVGFPAPLFHFVRLVGFGWCLKVSLWTYLSQECKGDLWYQTSCLNPLLF